MNTPIPGAASELLRKLRDCDIGDAFKREIDAVLAAPVTEGAQREAVAWRCFHCNQVFTDQELAREHFGPDSGMPRCAEDWASGRFGGPHDPRVKWLDEYRERAERAEAALSAAPPPPEREQPLSKSQAKRFAALSRVQPERVEAAYRVTMQCQKCGALGTADIKFQDSSPPNDASGGVTEG